MTDRTPAKHRPASNTSSNETRRATLTVVEPTQEPAFGRMVLLLVAAVLLPRLALMPWAENLYGDAVVRTDLAMRWALNPRWISSFDDGAFQFGPLHLYLMGLVLKLGAAPQWGGRLVSLVFGVATVLPLFSLTRRMFGWKAGVWACLGLGAWSLHLQMSTTAGSEALALFLVLAVLALIAKGVEENRFTPLFNAAVVLNLACATRYDAWLLIPLLSLALLLGDKDRVAAITRGVIFGLLCLPWPLIWMQGNALAKGDALYPIHFIEQFHRDWVGSEMGTWSSLGFRAQSLVFWPAVALFTLTPVVAGLGMLGMKRAWKERPELRWVLWVCLAPTLYYVFKAAVLANFVPLARFTVGQVVLLLPFVEPGYRALTGGWSRSSRRGLLATGAVLAVGMPLVLGALTFRNDAKLANGLRPVSPITTNPAPVMQVASYLKHEVADKGGALILDSAPGYLDLQLRFYSGVPEKRHTSHRWSDFQKYVDELKPGHLVLAEGGTLHQALAVSEGGRVVRLGDAEFVEVPGFSAPFRVYKKR